MRAPLFSLATLGLCLLAGGGPARAQQPEAKPEANPNTNANPAAVPGDAPVGGGAVKETRPPAKTSMAERRAQARAQGEFVMRAMMTDLGIAEAAPQDAVLAYLSEDEAGTKVVLSAHKRLIEAADQDAPLERIQRLLAIYKASIDADRERRRAAQSALDAKIGYSLNPRLEATLWRMGVLGDGPIGISLAALVSRNPRGGDRGGDNREGGRDGNRDGDNRDGDNRGDNRDGGRRGGTVCGVVTRKAQGWIEVRADGGALDRYLPFWAGGALGLRPGPTAPIPANELARFNRSTLEILARVKVGERVALDWVAGERKRVVRLEILPPETVPTTPVPAIPATPAPTEPTLPAATPAAATPAAAAPEFSDSTGPDVARLPL